MFRVLRNTADSEQFWSIFTVKKIEHNIIIFKDLFDMDRIQELQDAFASATGVASIITDPDGKAITRPSNFTRFCRDIVKKTEKGYSNCRHSDLITEKAIASPDAQASVITNCLSAGLWDAGAGIYLAERHIANWLIGQVRDVETDDLKFLSYAREIGADEDTFMEALAEVTCMNRTQFENVCKTLYLMTRQLSELAFRNVALSREMEARKSIEEERRKIEAQMFNAQKLESLGVLAGGIAHDFNNMLMVILGNADLALTSNPEGTQTHRRLFEIKKVARQAADLCSQMLAYSGRGQFVIENININEIIHEISQMLSMTVSKNTVIRYGLANDLCSIQGDLSQLRQVIMNLVANASDAIEQEQGLITVSTGISGRDQIEKSGSLIKGDLSSEKYVLLEVTDTGCGMNEMMISKIFDPFFTTKSTGRGLGMAVVLGIVRGHNGTIKVESQPGKGSKFRLFFPAASDENIYSKRITPVTGELPESGIGGTILLVDDEEGVRNVAVDMLECIGFEVLTASDGHEALEVLKENRQRIDCVMLDLTMPGISGVETYEEMRKIVPDLKIIIASGYNEADMSNRTIMNDLAGFIQKPYSIEMISKKLREVLEMSSD